MVLCHGELVWCSCTASSWSSVRSNLGDFHVFSKVICRAFSKINITRNIMIQDLKLHRKVVFIMFFNFPKELLEGKSCWWWSVQPKIGHRAVQIGPPFCKPLKCHYKVEIIHHYGFIWCFWTLLNVLRKPTKFGACWLCRSWAGDLQSLVIHQFMHLFQPWQQHKLCEWVN